MILLMKVIAGVASAATFLSLCAYIFLAYSGKSTTLFSTSNAVLLSKRQQLFLALAAIAFLICMYKGAEAMLWWLPNNWGALDEDGEFQTIKASIASVFTFIGGLSFINFIDSATHEKFALKLATQNARELARILSASTGSWELANLKSEYKEKLTEIEAVAYAPNGMRSYSADLLPDGRRAQLYRELLFYIESIEKQKGNGKMSGEA